MTKSLVINLLHARKEITYLLHNSTASHLLKPLTHILHGLKRSIGGTQKGMKRNALSVLMDTEGIGAVVEELIDLAKPFGDVEHWKFLRLPKKNVVRFFIKLYEPSKQPRLARLLGGKVVGSEICLEIPNCPPQHAHSPLQHSLFS